MQRVRSLSLGLSNLSGRWTGPGEQSVAMRVECYERQMAMAHRILAKILCNRTWSGTVAYFCGLGIAVPTASSGAIPAFERA